MENNSNHSSHASLWAVQIARANLKVHDIYADVGENVPLTLGALKPCVTRRDKKLNLGPGRETELPEAPWAPVNVSVLPHFCSRTTLGGFEKHSVSEVGGVRESHM